LRPADLSPELVFQEQRVLAEMTTLDMQELAAPRHAPFALREEVARFQRFLQRRAALRKLEEWLVRVHRERCMWLCAVAHRYFLS
jgi:hypothetical protein